MNLSLLTSWAELAFSVGATPLVLLFLYTLVTSALNKSCKVFLIMNALGLLFLTTSHISVAVYRLVKPGQWKGQDVTANLPLFLHQLAYSTCTVSMLLITVERTIIGLKPKLYVDKRVSQWALIAVCVLAEVFIAIPCVMLVQDGPVINGKKLYATSEMLQNITLAIYVTFDLSAVIMVIAAFVQTSQRYNRAFSRSTLGTRYEVKEVVALTRILIPICCSSLVFRFTVIALAYVAFGNEKVLDLFFTLIRFCCTVAAIIEPALLLSRHRLLQKRLRLLFGLPISEASRRDDLDPEAITKVYFDAFKNDLRGTKTRS